MRKHLSQYAGLVLIFGIAIVTLFQFAPAWVVEKSAASIPVVRSAAPWGALQSLQSNLQGMLGILLLQIVIVVVAAKAVGALFRYFKQPAVVGEMCAGILLGPSVLGALQPGLQNFIFPAGSLGSLKALSQIGVIIFMFGVGAELDLKIVKKKAHTAVVVSHVSIFLPFLAGIALAIPLYADYAMGGVDFKTFSLFMGIAMSITAFPVLASIIRERGMTGSVLGGTALACAAIDDITAWCILAGILALARASGLAGAGLTIALTCAYIALMIMVVKPRADKLRFHGDASQGQLMIGVTVLVFASALVTELIGIHALFGAFLAGVVVSNNAAIGHIVRERIEPLSTSLLLPIFFAYTGLRTHIGLLQDGHSWVMCAAIIAVATFGKLGGGAVAARFTGLGWRDALSLGALMNTRGLMELVVLNIGLDLGILSPRIFAMMVVMALVTTMMTGPLLSLFQSAGAKKMTLQGLPG